MKGSEDITADSVVVAGKKRSIEIHGDINPPVCDSVVSFLGLFMLFLYFLGRIRGLGI